MVHPSVPQIHSIESELLLLFVFSLLLLLLLLKRHSGSHIAAHPLTVILFVAGRSQTGHRHAYTHEWENRLLWHTFKNNFSQYDLLVHIMYNILIHD